MIGNIIASIVFFGMVFFCAWMLLKAVRDL